MCSVTCLDNTSTKILVGYRYSLCANRQNQKAPSPFYQKYSIDVMDKKNHVYLIKKTAKNRRIFFKFQGMQTTIFYFDRTDKTTSISCRFLKQYLK